MKYSLVLFLIISSFFVGCSKQEEKILRYTPLATSPPSSEPSPTASPEKIVLINAETPLLDKDENRIKNINIAISALNNYKIAKGEEFSFNKAVGPRTKERGYEKAIVLIDNKRDYDFGGGVCQISTTLYMATRDYDLKITEHHPHKKQVPYAEKNNDAAVDYDLLDLKFVNNTDEDIYISAELTENSLKICLYKLSA